MKTDEIIKLFDRIKMHYTMFTYNDEKVKEWHRFLKDYSSEDVNKRLDEYLSYEYENAPLCMTLTKGISRIEKENIDNSWITCCDICGEKITIYNNDMEEYEKHYRKCSKINFIDRMCKRYKGKDITMAKYYEMNEQELNAAYYKIMNFYLQNKDTETNGFLKEMPSD